MLTQIKMENFLSFINETVIDIKKTNYKLLENNTYQNVLKGVSFFGENASGKTNALSSIKFLLDLLFVDKEIQFILYHCFYSKNNLTKMDYSFEIDNYNINYNFVFDLEGIVEENLYINKKNIITRIGSNAKTYLLDNEEKYEDIDRSILFLRKIYFNTKFEGNQILKKWFTFLENSVYVNAFQHNAISYGKHNLQLNKYLKDNGIDSFQAFFDKYNFNYDLEYTNEIKNGNISFVEDEEKKALFFKRKGFDVALPFMFESLGNQTLLNLLPSLIHIVDNGGMLLIDEFSSGFHNDLEELIIKHFMKYSLNAQMFLVSHSTNILSNSLLRPDQIYAVEFIGTKGSTVKRFSDEQPRAAQNLEKMYLGGVFGGIPQYDFTKE